MRCGHKNWAAMEWNGKRWETWPARTDAIICLRCGEWLPLGPARDDERTAVELRAAQIAADLADGGCLMSFIEEWGFNNETVPLRGGGSIVLDTPKWRAGYLARCIAEHEEAP